MCILTLIGLHVSSRLPFLGRDGGKERGRECLCVLCCVSCGMTGGGRLTARGEIGLNDRLSRVCVCDMSGEDVASSPFSSRSVFFGLFLLPLQGWKEEDGQGERQEKDGARESTHN